MKKGLKIIVPLICIIIVGITFYMIYDIRNKVEEINYGTNDIEVNEVEEEIKVEIENIVEENDDTNTVENETSTNTVVANTTDTNTVQEEVSDDEDAYSKNKLDLAKSLVQKSWGEDSTVYFTNEGINSEGLYMVAARDKTSTAVKNYFKVNLNTKKVEVDY